MEVALDAGWESRLYRAQSWIQRAVGLRRVGDLDGRFIFYWIAFNALYGHAKYIAEDWQGEGASIHDSLGRIGRLSRHRRGLREMLTKVEADLAALLRNQFLCKEYWTEGFTDALDDSLHAAESTVRGAIRGTDSVIALLIRIFDRLYVLRIQLIHGCAKDGSSANRASLEPAVAVMAPFVPLYWATMKRAGGGEDWGPLPYPAWNRRGHPEEKRTRCFVVRH